MRYNKIFCIIRFICSIIIGRADREPPKNDKNTTENDKKDKTC